MSTTMPRVSVSIPCYNEEDRIGETIENVLGQTYEAFELIIVDDGSEDDTAAVVEQYMDDHRVRYVYQENRGYPGARNTGVEEGDGDYFAFIGADDLWEPKKLERQVEYLESNDADLVHSNVYHIDSSGEITGIRHGETPPRQTDREEFLRKLFIENFVCIQSVLCHRSVVERYQFDESLSINCDHDMWLKVAGEFDIDYMDEILVRKRYHGENISGNYRQLFEERKRLVEKTVERYPFLEPVRDRKLSSIYLTYGINLITDGEVSEGRRALRRSLHFDPTNWKSYGAYTLSLGGDRPVRAFASEGQ